MIKSIEVYIPNEISTTISNAEFSHLRTKQKHKVYLVDDIRKLLNDRIEYHNDRIGINPDKDDDVLWELQAILKQLGE